MILILRLFFGFYLAFAVACSKGTEDTARVLDLTDSRKLTLQQGEQSGYQLVRNQSRDTARKLDAEKTNEAFRQLGRLRLESGFDLSGAALEEYGLEQPELVVQVEGLKSKHTTISFGSFSNFAAKRYLRIDEESTVYLASEEVFQSLNKQQSYFLDDTLIDFAIGEVCSVSLSLDGKTRDFKKHGQIWEEKVSEEVRPVEAAQIEMLLKTLLMLKSKESVAPASSPVSLPYQFKIGSCDEEGLEVLVKISDLRKDAFDIEGEPLYIESSQRDGAIFVVKRTESPILNPLAMSFHRAHPFNRHLNEVFEAQFLHSLDPRVYRRVGENWFVNGEKGDRPFVEASLSALVDLQAVRYIENRTLRDTISRQKPLIDFRLLGKEKQTLLAGSLWWNEEQERFFGGDAAYDEVFEVDPAQVKKVFPERQSLFPVADEKSIARPSIG